MTNNVLRKILNSVFVSPLFFFLACSSAPNQALAWGKIGHKVVGEIASNHLNAKAKKAVLEILDNRTLADVSIFADEVRSDPAYKSTYPLHYVSIPKGQTYTESVKNPNGDIVVGIQNYSQTLKDSNQSLEKRKEALMFLVHFMGDLHQPLHVGYAEDRGGNDVALTWFNVVTNLHEVWDEKLIQFEELSYTEYAQMLERMFAKGKDHASNWMSGDVLDWVQESQDVRDSIYPAQGEKDLKYLYHYQHKDLVYKKLFQGGVRLAYKLNQLLGK